MKYRLLFLAPLLFAIPTKADIAVGRPTFNWTQPAIWSDGSAVTASQITGYQLNCGTTVNVRLAAGAGIPPSTYPPTSQAALLPGTYTCTLAVYGRKTPTDTEVLGMASDPVTFIVPQPRMNAPTDFSVE